MASIKNLKSKGKAVAPINLRAPSGRESCASDVDYAYRKVIFADLPPAKIVRPLRAIRKVYEQALAAWERSFVDGQLQQSFPHSEDVTYRNAMRFAKAGQGQLVRRCAS